MTPPFTFTIDGKRVHIYGLELTVFGIFYNSKGKVWNMGELHKLMYKNRSDGGALEEIVKLIIHRLRLKLKGTRFAIKNRRSLGWYMVRV